MAINSRDWHLGSPVILYDGECSLCTAQATNLEAFSNYQVRARALQSIETSDPRLTKEELVREIKLVMPDGQVFGGAEAIVQLAVQGRPLMWRIFSLYYLPGIRFMGDWLYAWVARNRYRLFGRQEYNACDTGSCARPGTTKH